MTNFYYQTRRGKRVKVRKKYPIKRDIVDGTKSAATSAGFVLGTGAGVGVAKAIGKNPVAKTVLMSGGAIAGSTIATILANRILYRRNNNGHKTRG